MESPNGRFMTYISGFTTRLLFHSLSDRGVWDQIHCIRRSLIIFSLFQQSKTSLEDNQIESSALNAASTVRTYKNVLIHKYIFCMAHRTTSDWKTVMKLSKLSPPKASHWRTLPCFSQAEGKFSSTQSDVSVMLTRLIFLIFYKSFWFWE